MLKLEMLILSLAENSSEKTVTESLKILKKRGIVAYPTESFYALGVLATDESAVKKLYKLKKRPTEKPLPIIVGDMNTFEAIVKSIPAQAKNLMEKYWPGPLTIIFEAKCNMPELLTGGTGKVAVRIPGESAALDLARALQLPITATSANPSAKAPAEDVKTIIHYFGDNIDLIIDAGKAPGGKPSTIVDVTVTPLEVLREGSILLD